MITHKTILLSGVECEFKEFTGKHQEMLSVNNKTPMSDRLNAVVEDIIVKLGSIRPDKDMVKAMLVGDKRKLLCAARMASLDNEPTFDFDYDYEEEGETKKMPLSVPLLTTDAEGNEVVGFNESKYKIQYTEYSDVIANKKVRVYLPRTQKEAEFTLLDGFGEAKVNSLKEENLNSNTPLLMRNVCILEPKESGDTIPIQADLKTLPIKDIEVIRTAIKEHEGKIDTEVRFNHPVTGKPVVVDMLNCIAFFFPSQAL